LGIPAANPVVCGSWLVARALRSLPFNPQSAIRNPQSQLPVNRQS
jgi:hypothetical protein